VVNRTFQGEKLPWKATFDLMYNKRNSEKKMKIKLNEKYLQDSHAWFAEFLGAVGQVLIFLSLGRQNDEMQTNQTPISSRYFMDIALYININFKMGRIRGSDYTKAASTAWQTKPMIGHIKSLY